ncbi:MAG TPA: GMC family oxidoreductase [Candidatus Acidoferrum sp.]|nr:GMC family oxidoreductase [Candidatus Acidoferrum sp.]
MSDLYLPQSAKAQDPLLQTYDAVVVGSGATGGWAAKQLAEAGLKVALLEAGRAVSPKEFTEHMPSYKLKYRDHSPEIARTRPVQTQCYACMEYNYEWFVNDLENPYSTPAGKPFTWQRLRILGGRSLVWGRQSYRLSDSDFKAASRDGYGDDWPFSYADLAPYYDIVEKYVGITGAAEGNEMLPDGQFLPPMKMSCGEILLRERVKAKFGHTVTIGRAAIVTQAHNGRLPCHYCGPCERGCSTFSYFSSPFTTVKDALASGNCTLITNAVVSHVDMDNATNKARGVTYVDRMTRQVKEVRAKSVILCAQALESTRILLNSSTQEHPNGLGNSSGALGHYLMDHVVGGGAGGRLPDMKVSPNANEPQRPNGIYVPRFRNTPGKKDSRFLRGYGFQGGADAEFNFQAEGYGASFKKAVKDGSYGIRLGGFGESLARWDNFIEIDQNLKDAWGIPALRISMTHGDNEAALMQDAAATAAEMLEAAGAKDIKVTASVEMPGMAIHELGTARMGNDPKKSVLNPFNQSHDVKNVFVMDGASFVSSACQNPTLTMMAITVRACANLIDRFKKNEV